MFCSSSRVKRRLDCTACRAARLTALPCCGQGNKLNNVGVVYTPWANLRKTASMEVGQVRGMHLCCKHGICSSKVKAGLELSVQGQYHARG